MIDYAVNFVHKTRPGKDSSAEITKKYIQWGAGPRASSFLVLASKAKAILSGKATPDIEDVKAVAKPILRHRLVKNYKAEAEGISVDNIIENLIGFNKQSNHII